MAIKSVDPYTLKGWLDSNEAVLVDVREPDEYQAGNIAGATLVPLAAVSRQALPVASGKKLVIHCKGGVRSRSACEVLLAGDPNLEIYNLEGGIAAWAMAGLPVRIGKATR